MLITLYWLSTVFDEMYIQVLSPLLICLIFIFLLIRGILKSILGMNGLCITNILLVWGLPFHSFGDIFDKQKFLLLMEYNLLAFYLMFSTLYVLFKKCLHTLSL